MGARAHPAIESTQPRRDRRGRSRSRAGLIAHSESLAENVQEFVDDLRALEAAGLIETVVDHDGTVRYGAVRDMKSQSAPEPSWTSDAGLSAAAGSSEGSRCATFEVIGGTVDVSWSMPEKLCAAQARKQRKVEHGKRT